MTEKTEESIHSIESEKTADVTAPEASSLTSNPPTEPTTHFSEYEIITEQYQNYLVIAEAVVKTLKRPRDISIFTNLLRKVQSLNDSNQMKVKSNTNLFFRYFLKILKWTSENQPLELYQGLYDSAEADTESRNWIEENKTFNALKCLKDGTIVMYTAISNDPPTGWQEGGLNILANREAC